MGKPEPGQAGWAGAELGICEKLPAIGCGRSPCRFLSLVRARYVENGVSGSILRGKGSSTD